MTDRFNINYASYGVIISLFLSTLGVSAFTFTFPLLAAEKAVGGIWLGSAFSGYFFAKLILAPLAGSLADRIGSRPLLLAAALLGAGIPWVYLVNPEPSSLYIVQFGLGLAGGIMRPVGMTVIGTESDEDRQGSLFGGYNLVFNIALMLGPLTAGLLFLLGPTTPLLVFLSAAQLIAALILAICLRETQTEPEPDDGPSEQTRRSAVALLPLLIAVIGRTAGIGILISFYPLLLSEFMIGSRLTLALFFTIPTVFTCLTLPLARFWTTPGKRTAAAIIGMLISGTGLVVIGSAPALWSFLVGGMILGIGAGISAPAAMTLAVNVKDRVGSSAGLFYFGANLGFLVGPVGAGIIVQYGGELAAPFWCGGLGGILCCAPLVLQQHVTKRASGTARFIGLPLFTALLIFCLTFAPLHQQDNTMAGDRYTFTNIAMGTVIRLTLEHDNREEANAAAAAAFSRINAWQQDLDHRYREGSVGRINEAAGREPVVISELAAGLVARALDFCAASDGVFDVSIGAITRTPEYFRDKPTRTQRELVDCRLIEFDESKRRIFLPRKGMALDLGGLAKGTIVDGAVAALRAHGIASGVVEAGGDFFCFGPRQWRFGLQHPRRNELLGIISVRNRALCGSGDYYQFVFGENGDETKRKHHVVDISTGDSARRSIGVTTLAATTELADALATTLIIMGPDKGREFLRQHYPDAAALWVRADLTTAATANFPPLQQP